MKKDSELLQDFAEYYRKWIANPTKHRMSVGLCIVQKNWAFDTWINSNITYNESARVMAILEREKPKYHYLYRPYWFKPEDAGVRQFFLSRLVERYKLKEARDERTD